MNMNMKKTILSAALLAASSMAFAQGQGNAPATPPARGAAAMDRPAAAPTTPPAASDFGRDTAEQARELGTDAEARSSFGADVSAEAQARGGKPVVEDPVDEDPIEDPVDDEPIEDPVDDDDGIDDPDDEQPIDDPVDGDDDGIPDDIDDDADGDGTSDNGPLPNNTFGQDTREAAQDAEREGGLGPEQGDLARERNEQRATDTDGDGTNDYQDTDDDGDGIIDEADEDTDADGETDE